MVSPDCTTEPSRPMTEDVGEILLAAMEKGICLGSLAWEFDWIELNWNYHGTNLLAWTHEWEKAPWFCFTYVYKDTKKHMCADG